MMNVPIHSLMAHLDNSVRLVVFCEEKRLYVFKLYSSVPFGDFESPTIVMFDNTMLFCNDEKTTLRF